MKPAAYIHHMEIEGQDMPKLSFKRDPGFGIPGKDYDPSAKIWTEPLYTHKAKAAMRSPRSMTHTKRR